MSEAVEGAQATPAEPKQFTSPEKPAEAQASLWERLKALPSAEDAITPEAVAGDKAPEAAPEPVKSDRELVAPRLQEFLKPEEAPAEPVTPETGAEELTAEQQILAKLEALEAAQAEVKRQEAQAAKEAEFRSLRDALLSSVEEEKSSLPGFYALEQQDTLVQLAVAETQNGKVANELELARKIEAKARETWEKLNAVYGPTPSNESAEAQPAEPTPTLSTTTVSTEAPVDLSKMSSPDAQALLWERIKARG